MSKKPKTTTSLPSKADILAFIGNRPGKIGTREIARAFNLKNNLRAELKRLLRDMADEGAIEKRRRKLHKPGALPETVLADVTARDSEGDLIAVPDEWDEEAHGAAPKIRIVTSRRARPGQAAGMGDRVLLRVEAVEDEDGVRHRGHLIRIIEHPKQRVIGVFHAIHGGGGRIEPVDKKMIGKQLVVHKGAEGGAADGDLVSVEVARAARLGAPAGKVVERLGSLKTERAVSMIAIAAHGIPSVFRPDTLAEAAAAKPATLAGREDWRKVPLVTIDPPDAKDHDDAVYAEPDTGKGNPGGYIISVAIADVAHYVTPGSALDREALVRGNSVYFPDRVVPMLPERISNDLCSLRPNEDRPALAVRMVIAADGRKLSHTFHRIMMRSAAKLAYAQAQDAIDGRTDDTTGPLLEPVLKPLYDAYDALKRTRGERSPLDLDLPERKIVLKADGTVDRVIVPERLDAHRLIEEFMILANVAAAETLEKARVPLIYRVHDEPSMEKLHALREFLQTLDIPLAKSGALRPQQFNRILAAVKDRDNEQLVNEVVLRSQAQAEYSAQNYGHFGLNLRRYAHFTSPIRRYSDLIVHRALIRALGLGPDGLPDDADVKALTEIAAQISAAERRAMVAERETVDRLIAHFLADRIGASFEGRISGVTRAGLFVKLIETGADGFVPARFIGDDYFQFDEAGRAMRGRRSGESYRLGDPVTVKLVEAAPVAGALRFELLSEGRFDGERRRAPGRTERDADRARRGHHEAMARKSKHKANRKSKKHKSKFKGQRKSR
ncbi:MAG: ribonuclease R [Xanthobacteraceae bacterium]|uniref:ribonuclease R n=1 Tax=Pseudolabrys sp. TaxID=1960880 RepID=UPI003D0F1E2B